MKKRPTIKRRLGSATTPTAELKVGDRVQLIQDVERYPHFMARRGITGTVTFVGRDKPSPSADVTLLVKADQLIRGAEPWDNEIEWSHDDDPMKDLKVIGAGRKFIASERDDDDTGFGRHPRSPLAIPGWSVGYNEEISAHAATRSPKKNWLFVMTTPEDREPRRLDEEATVGLYYLNEDGDWEQIAYQDFPDVASVIKLSNAELQLIIEHGLDIDQSRTLLEDEFTDWQDGVDSVLHSWMKMILKDAGADPGDDMAPQEGIEQVLNASHQQILDYMNARTEAINE